MKKIFTFLFASLFTIAAFAADRRPVMNVQNRSYYKVVVDGRPVYGDFTEIGYGRHTITVMEERNGFWGRRMKVVSSSDFRVDGDDRKIFVDIDRTGCVRVSKSEYGDNEDRRGWNQDDKRFDRDNRDGNGGAYDHDRDNGRPNKGF